MSYKTGQLYLLLTVTAFGPAEVTKAQAESLTDDAVRNNVSL